MSLVPDLTKTAVVPLNRSASDSPNSSVSSSDRAARDSIVSTQRLLPYSSTAAPGDNLPSRHATRPRGRCPRDVTLPGNHDNDAMLVWSTVTSAGGRVTLPGSGQYFPFHQIITITPPPPPIGKWSIVMSVSVCLFVCVLVCSRSCLRNYTSDLHQNFCACYQWPWLGPPMAA